MTMRYSIRLIDYNGKDSFLSIKRKTQWKNLAFAKKHCDEIRAVQGKGGILDFAIANVENQFGEIVY